MSNETEILRKNITDQLDRLVRQLAECEEFKSDLEEDEYLEMKRDTKAQMEEFSASLDKLSAGDLSLLSDVATMRLAIRAAISEAFRTPEIISLFARKQPAQLRLKLAELEREAKLSRCDVDERRVELLTALEKLGEELSPDEAAFLKAKQSPALAQLEKAGTQIGSEEKIFSLVASSKK